MSVSKTLAFVVCLYVFRPICFVFFFFFNDTATTEIYTLSLHDALPISPPPWIVTGLDTYMKHYISPCKGGLTESQNLGLFRYILLLLISRHRSAGEDASFLLAQTKELSNSLLRHSMQFEAFLYDEEPSFKTPKTHANLMKISDNLWSLTCVVDWEQHG